MTEFVKRVAGRATAVTVEAPFWFGIGIGLVAIGVSMIYLPAAVIFAGVVFAALAVGDMRGGGRRS